VLPAVLVDEQHAAWLGGLIISGPPFPVTALRAVDDLRRLGANSTIDTIVETYCRECVRLAIEREIEEQTTRIALIESRRAKHKMVRLYRFHRRDFRFDLPIQSLLECRLLLEEPFHQRGDLSGILDRAGMQIPQVTTRYPLDARHETSAI